MEEEVDEGRAYVGLDEHQGHAVGEHAYGRGRGRPDAGKTPELEGGPGDDPAVLAGHDLGRPV